MDKQKYIRNIYLGTGEIAHQVRALVVLPKDWGWILSTAWQLTAVDNYSSRIWHPHKSIHAGKIPIHKKWKKIKKKKVLKEISFVNVSHTINKSKHFAPETKSFYSLFSQFFDYEHHPLSWLYEKFNVLFSSLLILSTFYQ